MKQPCKSSAIPIHIDEESAKTSNLRTLESASALWDAHIISQRDRRRKHYESE